MVESQVDWLTLTKNKPDSLQPLLELGYRLVDNQVRKGNLPQPWSWKGYLGAHAGAVTYGEREDGAILQISGASANGFLGETLPIGARCTRIDLQITANLGGEISDVAKAAYADIRNAPLVRGTRPKGTLYENTQGGQTCYVGSPSSAHRGRIYDKWRESGLEYYVNCWRWEVESRQDRAEALYNRVGKATDQPTLIAGYVGGWFKQRSIRLPWTVNTLWALAPSPADRTDIQRKLQWLERQVKPTVEFLRLHGEERQAIMALGLDET